MSEGSATSGWAEVIPLSCGGDTAELLNEAVRWPFTSVLREWRMKGKGFQKLKDERGLRTSFRPTTVLFLEHRRVFAAIMGLVGSATF